MSGDEEVFTPRKGSRNRRPSAKAVENALSNLKISSYYSPIHETAEADSGSDDSDQALKKPAVLHDNELLGGNKLFTFHERKKCEAVINKQSMMEHEGNAKTPHAFRNAMKKKIASEIYKENDSSDPDFSASSDEYVPSESSDESESNSDEEKLSLDSSECEAEGPIVKKKSIALPDKSTILNKANKKYTIKTDDYFLNHASTKIITSSHTLDKLETPRLPQDQLRKLLSKMKLDSEHSGCTKKLNKLYEMYFSKWMYLMHENMSILLYGLGSKRDLLNSFHEKYLKTLPTVVINGYFPSLVVKDILDAIILTALELKENPANIYEACDLIEREFSYISHMHLYVIVHNIDMIKGPKAQSVFARIAAVKNIHLIASIDHINAPLIWDQAKLSKFNFSWWDCTTFKQYAEETSFESSMLVQRTGTLALSSLRNIFLSLTSNSKGIFLALAKYQIENDKKQYYQGLSFKDLYSICRESFLVSSDLALRAQLTEFVDHKMVKFKRSGDGTEYLHIPIQNTLLHQFLNEQ